MERSYGFPSNYFQNKYLLIASLRMVKKSPQFVQHMTVAAIFRARKLLQNLWQIYGSISRFVIDPISITYMLQPTLWLENCFKIYGKYMSLYQYFWLSQSITYMLQPFLGLENCFKIYGKNMSLYKISNWPTMSLESRPIHFLHVAAIFRARKENCFKIYGRYKRLYQDFLLT